MIKVNAIAQAHMIKMLLEEPHSLTEIAEETGLHYVTVCDYTRALHKVGAAHIAGWDEDRRGRACVKLYKLGKGKDVKRQPVTAAERQRRARAKKQMAKLLGVAA